MPDLLRRPREAVRLATLVVANIVALAATFAATPSPASAQAPEATQPKPQSPPELDRFDPDAPYATAARENTLPPLLAWDGQSRALALPQDSADPWLTPCERSGLTATPRYSETVEWLTRLAKASPQVEMVSLGQSDEGRDIWMMIVSAEGALSPDRLHAPGKPVVLAQAGIHSGEIDGKDAGMMLLRDMTVRGTKRDLLNDVSFLFVPILSVDAHERFSRTARVNQRGPVEQGWRTNARNLNLNRDYTKLDTPEVRAIVEAMNLWRPDLYLDIHVTDGIDYQYDITWGSNGGHAYSPNGARWLAETLNPAIASELRRMGHIPGPLIFANDPLDLEKGIVDWTSSARFSQGYGAARHLPSILIENHSLKPYDQRVLGTYVFLEAVLRTVGEQGRDLRKAIQQDRALRPDTVPLSWKPADGPAPRFPMLAIEARPDSSRVTGARYPVYSGRAVTVDVPVQRFDQPAVVVQRPKAYLIPPTYPTVIERLRLHGLSTERLDRPRTLDVDMFRIVGARIQSQAYEGHARVEGTPTRERRRETFPAGTVRVPTDQPLGELAVLLLDPASEDSFFQWGFFLEVLERTEYIEDYVMEPMAQRMLDADPALRAAFEQRLRDDPEFAADARQRLEWFYRRTPYFDQRWRLYPVGLEP